MVGICFDIYVGRAVLKYKFESKIGRATFEASANTVKTQRKEQAQFTKAQFGCGCFDGATSEQTASGGDRRTSYALIIYSDASSVKDITTVSI
jgi:hypothetical protein